MWARGLRRAAGAAAGAGAGLGLAAWGSRLAPPTALCDQRARLDGRPSLDAFGEGAPSTPSAYKAQFAASYDAAALQSEARRAEHQQPAGTGAEAAERRVRRGIATHLMSKLGYSAEELGQLGDDVLRMQGVSSPFRAARLREGEAVLDLGSGFGIDAFLAARKVGSRGRVVGLDISAEEVRQASKRAAERGLAQTSFVVGDMEALPMDAGRFDVVISNGGFCLCPGEHGRLRTVSRRWAALSHRCRCVAQTSARPSARSCACCGRGAGSPSRAPCSGASCRSWARASAGHRAWRSSCPKPPSCRC